MPSAFASDCCFSASARSPVKHPRGSCMTCGSSSSRTGNCWTPQSPGVVGEEAVHADLPEMMGEPAASLVIDRVNQDGEASTLEIADEACAKSLRRA